MVRMLWRCFLRSQQWTYGASMPISSLLGVQSTCQPKSQHTLTIQARWWPYYTAPSQPSPPQLQQSTLWWRMILGAFTSRLSAPLSPKCGLAGSPARWTHGRSPLTPEKDSALLHQRTSWNYSLFWGWWAEFEKSYAENFRSFSTTDIPIGAKCLQTFLFTSPLDNGSNSTSSLHQHLHTTKT